MRNLLASDVLSSKMVELMQYYQKSLNYPPSLQLTVVLLEHTSVLIRIFCEDHRPIESLADSRIRELLDVLNFFLNWEKQFSDPKDVKNT